MNNLSSSITGSSIHEHVQKYLDQAWSPIPVEPQSKKTLRNDWPKGGIVNKENIATLFIDEKNIGVVLGDPSGGLVDIDIDARDALPFAEVFLPSTGMIFGRPSNQRSHWIFQVARPERLYQTRDEHGEVIIEVRGNGHFTVFPPSIHVTGESIFFEQEGEPGTATWEELVQAALNISIATVLTRAWKSGSRHDITLSVAGYLARQGWAESEVINIIEAVAQHVGDGELDDRIAAVSTTFARYGNSQPITGRRELENLIGSQVVARIDRWLGNSHKDHTASTPTVPPADIASLHQATRSDIDLSRHLGAVLRGDLIYCPTTKAWYRREHQVYTPAPDSVADQVVIAALTSIADQVAPLTSNGNSRSRLLSGARVASVTRLLSTDERLHRHSSAFDRSIDRLGCVDGSLLDIDKGSLVDPDPGQIITKRLGSTFDRGAQALAWHRFLEVTFNGDQKLIAFIQRAVGYCLTGQGTERCMFVLIGVGANGKSTFLNVVRRLFGDYGGSTPSHTLMASRFGQTNTDDLAALVGKRFVQAGETENGDRLAEAKIKAMTGNDPIPCRALYCNYFTYDPQFVLWLATNEMPTISGGAEAVWERLRVIPFEVIIPAEQRDRDLLEKLVAELPGILNWAIEGYHEWKKQGLNPPDKVMQTRSQYRAENDFVMQWIEQECTVGDGLQSPSGDLYRAFSNWASGNRIEVAINTIKFSHELERLGYRKTKTKKGMRWHGLCLSNAVEFQERIVTIKAA